MSLDVEFGNITIEEAERLNGGPTDQHEPGSTEPWISNLVGNFVIASGAKHVLETGSFMGRTSRVIADALAAIGGGHFTVVEIDRARAEATGRRLEAYPTVCCQTYCQDILKILPTLPNFDLAFIDDDHTKAHVQREIELLYPKMNPGGLILLHDVWGSTDLQTVVKQWGGLALDLPRMGPAGGLGLIQVP